MTWADSKDLRCVVLCAGRGTRMSVHSQEKPKVMLEIRDKPILQYVIEYWKKYTEDFIFVVGYKGEQVVEFASRLNINSQFVNQKELKGIADAISLTRGLVADRFIVVLGDCLCNGTFDFPDNMEQGVGVWEADDTEDIKRSYSIEISSDLVSWVKEKPKEICNNLCGMGFYFFDKRVFDYIESTTPSSLRGEIEITDTIQNMISSGEKIAPVFCRGDYLNVTYPEDLVEAERLLRLI